LRGEPSRISSRRRSLPSEHCVLSLLSVIGGWMRDSLPAVRMLIETQKVRLGGGQAFAEDRRSRLRS
jgi:hypothetical protein